MNPSFIREFSWFRNMKSGPRHRIAFALPGLVFGLNNTVLDAIEEIRKALGQATIDLYIFTWNIPLNMLWVNKLKALTKKGSGKYCNINVHIEIVKYEDSSIRDIAFDITRELNVNIEEESQFIFSRSNFKRLVNAYVHYRTYNMIFKKPSIRHKLKNEVDIETLIFRISPKMIFRETDYIASRLLPILYDMYDGIGKSLTRGVLKDIEHPYDILVSSQMSSTSIDDLFYCSSPSTLVNMFGTDDMEFKSKIISFYKKYQHQYSGKINSQTDLRLYGGNYDVLPIEASVFLHHLHQEAKKPVVVYTDRFIWSFITKMDYVKNPWYEIYHNKIISNDISKGDPNFKEGLNFEIFEDLYILNKNEL